MPSLGLELCVTKPNSILESFDPLSLNPLWWHHTTGSDDNVWPDLAGNVELAAGVAAPAIVPNVLNGHQGRQFTGTESLSGSISLTGTQYGFFCVCTLSASSATYARIVTVGNSSDDDFDDPAFACSPIRSVNTEAISIFRNSAEVSTKAITYDEPFISLVWFDGTNATLYINGAPGTPAGSSGSFNAIELSLGIGFGPSGGATSFLSGYIFSDMCLEAPTKPQLNAVGAYLASVFALSWTPIV